MLPPNAPAPLQLTLPLDDLAPALPQLAPENVILPRQLWTTLAPLQRDQLAQRLISLLQEVFHAPNRTGDDHPAAS